MTFAKFIWILVLCLAWLNWGECQAMSNEELNKHIQTGWQCYQQGNGHGAIQHWEKIIPILRQSYEKTGNKEMGGHLLKLHATIGLIYQNLGDAPQALYHYQRVLPIYTQLYGPNNPNQDIAAVLYNIATLYKQTNHYQEALKYFQATLEMRYQLYGRNTAHPDIILSLHQLGTIQQELGDYAEAFYSFQAVLEMRYQLHGKSTPHSDIVKALNSLGSVCISAENHTEALKYFQAGLDMAYQLYGKNNPHPDIAASLNNVGISYHSLRNYTESLKYHQASLEMKWKIYGKNTAHWDITASLNNIAKMYQDLGNYTESLKYYQATLEMKYQLYGKNNLHPDLAFSLNNVSSIYHNLKNYPEALKYAQAALEMRIQLYGKENPNLDVIQSLHNIALIHKASKNYAEALKYYQVVLKMSYQLYGQEKPSIAIATALNDIGTLYEESGNTQEALKYLLQSLDIIYQLYGKDKIHPDIAAFLNHIGALYYISGNYAEALKYCQEALDMSYLLYGQTNPHLDMVTGCNNIIMLDIRNKNYPEAWKKLASLERMIQHLFETYTSMGSEKDMRVIWNEYFTPMNNSLLTLASLDTNKKYVPYAYQIILGNKRAYQRLLMSRRQILAEIQDPKMLQLHENYQKSLHNFSKLAFIPQDHPDRNKFVQQREELSQKYKEMEANLNQKFLAFRTLRQYPKIDRTIIQRQIKDDTVLFEFIIFFHLTEKKDWLGCFVVKGKSIAFVSLGPTEKIQPVVEDLLQAIRDDMKQFTEESKKSPLVGQNYLQAQVPRIQSQAWKAAQLLYQPLAKHCGNVRQLVIAPDGFLHLLPFGLLTQKKGNQFEYLVERYNFVYCFGGDSFTKTASSLPPNLAFYGIDNPDFDLSPQASELGIPHQNNTPANDEPFNSNHSPFLGEVATPDNTMNPTSSLPSQKISPFQGLQFKKLNQWKEMQQLTTTVKKNFPKAKITMDSGQDALLSLAKIHIPRANWVHLISHAFFLNAKQGQNQHDTLWSHTQFLSNKNLGDNPKNYETPLLLSGVVFAGVNQPAKGSQENSYLTSQEIALLKLNNLRCMIFPYCGINLNKAEQAAGFSGFKWSLEYAGVQHSILSLWDSSHSSSSLLDEFYTNALNEKAAIPAVLNSIQRNKATSLTYTSHPGIWAVLICNGIPQK